jgi:drug/metabolite transporter (DMT)-like permease
MKPDRLTLYGQLLLGMSIFGSGTPISKIVTEGLPPFLASGMRMLVAFVVLLPFVWSRLEHLRDLEKQDYKALAAITLVGMFGFSLFMLFGMRLVSGVAGSIIMSTTPAVTAVAAWMFLNNHLGWRKIAAVGLAVTGVLVLQLSNASGGDGRNILLGSLLVFAAVCSEATFTLSARVTSDKLDPELIAAATSAAAFVIFLPFMIYDVATYDFSQTILENWVAMLWWGAGTLALGTTIWYTGVKQVEGSIAAGFMGVMPVSALVLSYVLLGETFEWIHLLGFGIVFVGVVLIIDAHRRASQPEDEPQQEQHQQASDTT